MRRPRLLGLFCGEGGAGVGYARAGFEVVGVDTDARALRRYPFESVAGDALVFVGRFGQDFDAIHASPPCQHASAGTRASRDRGRYPALIPATRAALVVTGRPWVIENVKGADLRAPLTLCGSMFDLIGLDDDGELLRLERHRLFEASMPMIAPRPDHHDRRVSVAGSYGGARRDRWEAKHVRHGGYVPSIPVQRELLGIDWMTQHGMHQSIPPAYTEHVGAQLLASARRVVAS